MARVYTERLLAGSGTATTYSATCPDGFLWVVRDAVLGWDGSSDGGTEFYNLSITDPALLIDFGGPVGGTGRVVDHWQGRQVVQEGETLEFASTTATWFVVVTGYALSLP